MAGNGIDFTEFYKANGKCCVSGKPMHDSKYMNMVATEFKVRWQYPRTGNLEAGIDGLAVAIIHDDCINPETGQTTEPIKWVVETTGEKIIYHPVGEMEIHPAYKPSRIIRPSNFLRKN